MSVSKKRAEYFFAALAGVIIKFRFPVLIAVILIAGLLASNIRHLKFDTSNEGFLHEDDPILLTYNNFRDQFGRDDMLVLAIRSDKIFTTAFLTKLKVLHDELTETIPHINEVTSMVNARSTLGEGDVLLVDDLLADFPESDSDLKALRDMVMTNPLYINQLISQDSLYTTVIIESDVYTGNGEEDLLAGFEEQDIDEEDTGTSSGKFLSDQENSAFVQAVRKVVQKHSGEDFYINFAGTPAVMHSIKTFMKQDVQKFMRLAVLIIGICLFCMFRRASGVVLPLLVVALSVVSTIGLMALLDVSFKLPTTILPSFLLAVGVGASVHVLSLTFQNLRKGLLRKEAIVAAFSHSGLAIVMTSLTTAAGLASFSMAKVAPIADLGFYSAVGVIISLSYTMTFLPALMSLLPLKQVSGRHPEPTILDRLLDRLAEFSVTRYRLVLIVATVIISLGLIGISRIHFSHNVLIWLPKDLDVRQSTVEIDREMRGSVVLEVILDSGKENGLYNRDILLSLDRLTQELERDYGDREVFIGKSISVTTIVKEIHQALHGNDPAFYKIPENEKLIPQEFLLFENSGSEDLEDVVDSQFRLARVTLKVPWQDALLYVPFINDVKSRFEAEFAGRQLQDGEAMQVTVTGIMSLFGRIIHAAIYSAAQSYGIALVVITVMMVVLIGNLRLGFISMIPNLAPIFSVLGFMGWMSIQLDMFTMLIASIAIGLAVDDTIHFMYNFRRYYEETGEVAEAVKHTLHTAGRAMLTTSIVLSIGFFIFMFASMNNLFYFGLLTGFAIILALLADLLLAPALMAVVVDSRKRTTSDQLSSDIR